jgi:hypothetical protein
MQVNVCSGQMMPGAPTVGCAGHAMFILVCALLSLRDEARIHGQDYQTACWYFNSVMKCLWLLLA